jgi:hypothetical protein
MNFLLEKCHFALQTRQFVSAYSQNKNFLVDERKIQIRVLGINEKQSLRKKN